MVVREDNYLVVGGTSSDIINGEKRLGGSAYYASLALIHLGVKPIIITNSPILNKVFKGSARILSPPDGTEITYEIRENSGRRELKLVVSPTTNLLRLLKKSVLNNSFRAKGVIISPIAHELGVRNLRKLMNYLKAIIVGIDIQGFVRGFKSSGFVDINYERFYDLINSFNCYGKKCFLKGDINEFPPSCREASIKNCVNEGFEGIIIQTNAGYSLHVYNSVSGKFFTLRPLPGITGEEVGTGDVFTAVLTYFLGKGENLIQAVTKASVAGGLKVARPNPPWFTPNELEVMMRKVKVIRGWGGRSGKA